MSPYPSASTVTNDQLDAMRETINALRRRDALTVVTLAAVLGALAEWSETASRRTAALESENRRLRAQLEARCKCAIRPLCPSAPTAAEPVPL